MKLTLKQAAEATGKSKPTLLRAIQSSKISAARDELTGAWMVDPAELHRVYPAISDGAARTDATTHGASEFYERLLAEKDRQIASLTDQLAATSGQLEAANDERRTTLRQLTALLTDQRAKPPEAIPMPPPTSEAIIPTTSAANQDAAQTLKRRRWGIFGRRASGA